MKPFNYPAMISEGEKISFLKTAGYLIPRGDLSFHLQIGCVWGDGICCSSHLREVENAICSIEKSTFRWIERLTFHLLVCSLSPNGNPQRLFWNIRRYLSFYLNLHFLYSPDSTRLHQKGVSLSHTLYKEEMRPYGSVDSSIPDTWYHQSSVTKEEGNQKPFISPGDERNVRRLVVWVVNERGWTS